MGSPAISRHLPPSPYVHASDEKRSYLESQFRAADTNGDGVVDYNECVAFY